MIVTRSAVCLLVCVALVWLTGCQSASSAASAGTETPAGLVSLATPTLSAEVQAALSTPAVPVVRHVVQSGETLYAIALQYGTTLETVMEMNGIEDPDRLSAGEVLVLPRPSPTATPDPNAPAATYPPPPGQVNGVPYSTILQLSEAARQHAREIVALGASLGNNRRAFSKVGDSTIENPFFLARFDSSPYDLGDYVYLQETVDYFAGSFGRDSIAVRVGLHSWSAMDPQWADKSICQPNENVLACELRIHRPAIVLLRLGSNDAGVPESFRQNMQAIIDTALIKGVVPVLGTKADRHEGDDTNNQIIRELAALNRLPLWDYDAVAATIPGRGLDVDNVHLTTYYEHDYTRPEAFQRGHAVHNLTALIVLDILRQEILE